MQTCSHCSLSNPDTSRFCARCGQPLASSATGQLSPQAILAGRYIIVRLLGQGGMGAVYLASDNRIPGKVWAVKEMSDAALLDPAEKLAAIRAFESEANLLANLDHPNIPKVVDYFAEGGKYFLVMDFVPGKTLEAMMEERRVPFPEQQVAEWGTQLCDVLSYLHSRQPPVIFRDLKPGNIILHPDGTLKLIDFGIARLFKAGRSADTVAIGTPGFAAPEQHGRAQTDARSDLYSLGVLLHHLATGHDPSSDPFNLPAARRLNPQLSMHFDEVVARATALQAQSRFQTASAMRQALTTASVASPSSAFGGGGLQRSTQRLGGRWLLVILAFVAIAALTVGTSLAIRRPPAPPVVAVADTSSSPAAAVPDTPTPARPSSDTVAPITDAPQPPTPMAIPTRFTPTVTKPPPAPTRPTPTPDMDTIQAEVEGVMTRWSDIHKRAVRQAREDELAGILAGEALEKQQGSIRWLRDNNAYWEVTTYARRFDAWEYVTPTWVRVLAWRDEKGDYYQDGKHYPRSSYHDQYRVRFVIEKIGAQWYITCKGTLESGKPEPCLLTPP